MVLPTDMHPELYQIVQSIIKMLDPRHSETSPLTPLQKRGELETNSLSFGGDMPAGISSERGGSEPEPKSVFQNQIIHGDLCGNILFHESLPPAVIDFSLDYRPREYAEAILIADSIAWENGGDEAYSLLPPHSEQILLRACLFRLLTKALLKPWDLELFLTRSRGYRDIIRQVMN